jgi:hypothetical protein
MELASQEKMQAVDNLELFLPITILEATETCAGENKPGPTGKSLSLARLAFRRLADLKPERLGEFTGQMKNPDNSFTDSTIIAWAQLQLPARIDASRIARVLGFAEHDIPILIKAGLLKPLGKPVPNATKWFSSMEAVRLARDLTWLDSATKRISQHWMQKNANRRTEHPNLPAAVR